MPHEDLLCGLIQKIDEKGIHKFKINYFRSRLRLQKYVYLVSYFNDDLNYTYNLYIHGPYSPDLAKDYYHISESECKPRDIIIDNNYYNLVRNRTAKWLEIATTYDYIKNKNIGLEKEEIIKYVTMTKENTTSKMVNEISTELEGFIPS